MRTSPLTLAAAVFLAAAVSSPAHAQSLSAMLKSYYGFTRNGKLVESDVTCGTSPVQLLRNDPSRLWDLESVTGANSCALGRTAAVTTTNGILLGASGGSYNETWVDDGFIVGYEMWCICSGAGTNIHIVEQKAQ